MFTRDKSSIKEKLQQGADWATDIGSSLDEVFVECKACTHLDQKVQRLSDALRVLPVDESACDLGNCTIHPQLMSKSKLERDHSDKRMISCPKIGLTTSFIEKPKSFRDFLDKRS